VPFAGKLLQVAEVLPVETMQRLLWPAVLPTCKVYWSAPETGVQVKVAVVSGKTVPGAGLVRVA
jgi:hypothetical protein